MSINLIWAQSISGVIGVDGGMPWHIPEDLQRFQKLTLGHPVVMGRKTWESLPKAFRPLPGRQNIVISREPASVFEGARHSADLQQALAAAAALDNEIWVIGGGAVYRQALPLASRIEVTEVDLEVSGDTFAPELGRDFVDSPIAGDVTDQQVSASTTLPQWQESTTGVRFRFRTYVRVGESTHRL